MSSTTCAHGPSHDQRRPGTGVTVTGWLVALCCVGFAAVNIAFEFTGRFTEGPYAEYAAGLTVVNWFVVALKVLGAAVALLSVTTRPGPRPPTVLAVLLWGAFATLGVYALGSVVQALGMVSGLTGGADQVDAAALSYLLFFLVFAAGYGALALSHSRRHRTRPGPAVLGVLGAPVVLALILLVAPALLACAGLMPTP
ncbi:hypothetical protein A6A08_18025 [Nocardiopsis sp. TSRI0078]|uniref:hypothetical protein n=1 Tax=unclassified Nocardiopsis TaxID=2649073 RepID=UPI00093F3661|nr:hypothetical protein [Nocardiopsis sp. TSRI0078]OKI22859.1 hypothetical protein A6A08_18025 [Nocardiopsis sp. TSRI0078]